VVNRARLRVEVSAGAMKLCSVAGVQNDTQRGEQPRPCRFHTDKVARRAVLHPREISMAIAWAMLALLWLALVSVIVWVIATAVARSR
jgi:hypothetical protein